MCPASLGSARAATNSTRTRHEPEANGRSIRTTMFVIRGGDRARASSTYPRSSHPLHGRRPGDQLDSGARLGGLRPRPAGLGASWQRCRAGGGRLAGRAARRQTPPSCRRGAPMARRDRPHLPDQPRRLPRRGATWPGPSAGPDPRPAQVEVARTRTRRPQTAGLLRPGRIQKTEHGTKSSAAPDLASPDRFERAAFSFTTSASCTVPVPTHTVPCDAASWSNSYRPRSRESCRRRNQLVRCV